MSLFNSMFQNSAASADDKLRWIPLRDITQLDTLISSSEEKPVVIFKHSTRCNISRMALRQFEKDYALHEQADAYFLDLLKHRDVSDQIAKKLNVPHQSPQLILIQGGKVVYDVSHERIDAATLAQQVAKK